MWRQKFKLKTTYIICSEHFAPSSFRMYSSLSKLFEKGSPKTSFSKEHRVHRRYHLFLQLVRIQTSSVKRDRIGGEAPQRIARRPMSNQTNHWPWCYRTGRGCPWPQRLFWNSFDYEGTYRLSVVNLFLSSPPYAFDSGRAVLGAGWLLHWCLPTSSLGWTTATLS